MSNASAREGFFANVTNVRRVTMVLSDHAFAGCVLHASRMHTWYPRRGSVVKWKLVFGNASPRTRATSVASGSKINFTHQNHFAKYVPTWHLAVAVSSPLLSIFCFGEPFPRTLSTANALSSMKSTLLYWRPCIARIRITVTSYCHSINYSTIRYISCHNVDYNGNYSIIYYRDVVVIVTIKKKLLRSYETFLCVTLL